MEKKLKKVRKTLRDMLYNFIFSTCRDDRLSLAEFTLICRALFRNDKGHIYIVPAEQLEQIFAVFDKNQDGESL